MGVLVAVDVADAVADAVWPGAAGKPVGSCGVRRLSLEKSLRIVGCSVQGGLSGLREADRNARGASW